MESFGKYLREERERRGIGIEEISRITKISPGQLKAIEHDDFAALPPIAFVKGFVRAYSRHVGLDSDEAILRLEQFLSEIEQDEEDTFGEIPVKQFRRASPDPRILMATIVAFISIVLVVIIFAFRSCGADGGAWEPTPPSQTRLSSSGEFHIESLARSLYLENNTTPYLPTVPPQSYRIHLVAAPPRNFIKAETQPAPSGNLHEGGPTTAGN